MNGNMKIMIYCGSDRVSFLSCVVPSYLVVSALSSQCEHASAFSFLYMRLTVFEQALPDECFTQQELNVFLRPTLSWQSLQEHHDLLEVHLAELVGPLH